MTYERNEPLATDGEYYSIAAQHNSQKHPVTIHGLRCNSHVRLASVLIGIACIPI